MATIRARTHFAVGRHVIRPGDLLDSTDPLVKGREHLFEDPDEAVRPIERATARPGEKRATRRAPKKEADSTGEAAGE